MKKRFYHATSYDTLKDILFDGYIKPHFGEIYLCEDPIDTLKFMFLRGIHDVAVFEILLDDTQVKESFDHNSKFFDCKCFVYNKKININSKVKIYKYKI